MKKETVVVSVVIPCYNAKKYIQESLDSVFSQTFKQYEIIVVDDSSTDRTRKILEGFKPKIKVLETYSNRGEAHARNKAIRIAKGKYIAFLDADDLWRPNKLEKQIKYLEEHPKIGLLYANAMCFEVSNGNKQNIRELRRDFTGDVFKELFWSNFIPGLTVIVRTSALKKAGLFDEHSRLRGAAADYDMWLRISRLYPVGHQPETLADYRLHDTNLLGLSYKELLLPYKYIYEKFYKLYSDTQERIGLTKSECIGDLYLRHAFMDSYNGSVRTATRKSLDALYYTPVKSLFSFLYIVLRIKNPRVWRPLLWRFETIHSKFVKRAD